MRDKDVRECVESFLRRAVRTVVIPASMGMGLALVGCSGSSSSGHADAAPDTSARRDTAARLDTAGINPNLDTYPIDRVVIKLDTARVTDTPLQIPDTRVDTARDTSVADRRDTQPSDTRDTARPDIVIRLDAGPDTSVIRLDVARDHAADTSTDVVHTDAVSSDTGDDV